MLIFILQSIWLYIAELAGKDLELDVILKFILYMSPRLIVLVLPLTILLASIMVFGSFAENYEFAAMKSTGISLQRAMRSLAVFITLLSVVTFFFANNVIPWAEFNFFNLRKNLAKVKPAMVIAEDQFNQIGDMNIKVGEKSGDRGQYLKDVVIHQGKPRRLGNYTVIKSKTGELTSEEDSDVLQLVLYDGNYYDAIQPKEVAERQRKPHVKSAFEKYTLNIDLGRINDVDFEERRYSDRYSMLTAQELSFTIDTLKTDHVKDIDELAGSLYNRSTASTLKLNVKPKEIDKPFEGNSLFDLFTPQKNIQMIESAINTTNSTLAIINTKKKTFAAKEKNLNKHVIYFYDKFALSFACIILFFVGAPLGALIRKGGFGLPIVIAISIFLTYNFIGIFAKNSAEDSSLDPVAATWLSTFIMLPFSIYLTNQATKDRPLLSLDGILVPLKRMLKAGLIDEVDEVTRLAPDSEAYGQLKTYSDEKLIDLMRNYRQYELDVSYRNSAIQLMNERGFSREELRFGGKLNNENYENAMRFKRDYDEKAVIASFLYIVVLLIGVGGAVLNNNGFPVMGKIMIGIGSLALILYLFALMRIFSNHTQIYKLLGQNRISNLLYLLLLGIPLFPLYRYYFGNRLREDMKQIR